MHERYVWPEMEHTVNILSERHQCLFLSLSLSEFRKRKSSYDPMSMFGFSTAAKVVINIYRYDLYGLRKY